MKVSGSNSTSQKCPSLPLALQDRVGFFLNRLGRLIWNQAMGKMSALGITPKHYGLLEIIATGDCASQKEIGAKHAIDRSTMVAHVDQLEKLGLVKRKVAPRDRRAYSLEITAKGERMRKKAKVKIDAVQEDFMKSLIQKERKELLRLLNKLYADQMIRHPDLM